MVTAREGGYKLFSVVHSLCAAAAPTDRLQHALEPSDLHASVSLIHQSHASSSKPASHPPPVVWLAAQLLGTCSQHCCLLPVLPCSKPPHQATGGDVQGQQQGSKKRRHSDSAEVDPAAVGTEGGATESEGEATEGADVEASAAGEHWWPSTASCRCRVYTRVLLNIGCMAFLRVI